MTPFTFVLRRGDESDAVTFYATSEAVALGYAKTWAKTHGWVVEGSA